MTNLQLDVKRSTFSRAREIEEQFKFRQIVKNLFGFVHRDLENDNKYRVFSIVQNTNRN